jgi:hypothetical protein
MSHAASAASEAEGAVVFLPSVSETRRSGRESVGDAIGVVVERPVSNAVGVSVRAREVREMVGGVVGAMVGGGVGAMLGRVV